MYHKHKLAPFFFDFLKTIEGCFLNYNTSKKYMQVFFCFFKRNWNFSSFFLFLCVFFLHAEHAYSIK